MKFKEKYVLKSIDNIVINSEEDAIYVVTKDDLKYFNKEVFNFTQYGKYYVVVVKEA